MNECKAGNNLVYLVDFIIIFYKKIILFRYIITTTNYINDNDWRMWINTIWMLSRR
jgi:hypothetical protein